MKFTLKDYQDEAVRDVLINLSKARKRWHEDGDKHAFSLTATTGAGKTVMAAAAFEALFYGDDGNDFEADPGAVVIWFSDDPALNEQTRFRLTEAADRLNYSDLVVVENTFNSEKFEAGKVYFLNTQKLGKKSLLVRGHDPVGQVGQLFFKSEVGSHDWGTSGVLVEHGQRRLSLVDGWARGLVKKRERRSRAVRYGTEVRLKPDSYTHRRGFAHLG